MNDLMRAIDTAMGEGPNNDSRDNAICFYCNAKVAACHFTQGRYISKIKKMAADHPDEVKIVHENKDGSIVAQIPIKCVKISWPRQGPEMTDEMREAARERMKKMRADMESKKNTRDE